MFTGLVEEVGRIRLAQKRGDGLTLAIQASHILQDISDGDSIAIDGVCLTVINFTDSEFSAQAVGETVSRSTFGHKTAGHTVNLERALRADARFGGHFVQGHVDGVAKIIAIETRDPGYWLSVRLPQKLAPFVVEKGSIALDGVSLTIAKIEGEMLSVAVIPHTWKATTLQFKKTSDSMNVEVDILAKYLKNFVQPFQESHRLSLQKLADLGY